MTIINNGNNYQFDMYHRFDSQGPKFKRLIIDIEHLDLSKLNLSSSSSSSSHYV